MDLAPGNMKLVGTTKSNGGRFGHVRIVGESELNGQTECAAFTCTGTAKVKGGLTVKGKLKLTGELTVDGDWLTGSASATGQIVVQGASRGEELKAAGMVQVRGDCEFERIRMHGALEADGLLSAETLELKMHGPSRAKEIGGGHIVVMMSRMGAIKNLVGSRTPTGLTADLIEGDVVELVHTKASIVRGNQVRIGPGCDIGKVEYRHTLAKSRGAHVAEERKVD